MAEKNSDSPGTDPIDWSRYAKDARDLLLAVSHAGPTAARVWTTAWCEWAMAAAGTHDRMALQWTEIIRNPSVGKAAIEKMHQDYKDYLADLAGIPERAVLEFLDRMEETGRAGRDAAAEDDALVKAAESFEAAAAEMVNRILTATESEHGRDARSAQAGSPGREDLIRSLEHLRAAQAGLEKRMQRKASRKPGPR